MTMIATLSIMGAAAAVQAGGLSDADIAQMIEPRIKAAMVEPDSMKLRWPYSWARRKDRTVTCGVLNSRNRMGGYSGDTFVILINPDNGNGPFFNIAESQSSYDGVTGMCEQMIEKGQLSPR